MRTGVLKRNPKNVGLRFGCDEIGGKHQRRGSQTEPADKLRKTENGGCSGIHGAKGGLAKRNVSRNFMPPARPMQCGTPRAEEHHSIHSPQKGRRDLGPHQSRPNPDCRKKAQKSKGMKEISGGAIAPRTSGSSRKNFAPFCGKIALARSDAVNPVEPSHRVNQGPSSRRFSICAHLRLNRIIPATNQYFRFCGEAGVQRMDSIRRAGSKFGLGVGICAPTL